MHVCVAVVDSVRSGSVAVVSGIYYYRDSVNNVNNDNVKNDSYVDDNIYMFSSVRQFRKIYQHYFIFVHVNINLLPNRRY